MQRLLSVSKQLTHKASTPTVLSSYYSTMSSGDKAQKVPREQQKDLHLLTMSTPNGQKAQIGLEECKALYGTDFSFEIVNIMTNAQKEPWFLKLGINGRIPVLVDNKVENGSDKPFSVQETAAILLYLAKRVDKNDTFGFKDDLQRNQCLQWIFWQMGGQGQYNHFNLYAKEKIPYAIQRYHDETLRLYDTMEAHLSGRYDDEKKEWLVGGKYSWADICNYPWAAMVERSGLTEEEFAKFPSVIEWRKRIASREAVKIAMGEKYKQN